MNPFWDITAWPVWVEATQYIRNNTIISSLSFEAIKNPNDCLTTIGNYCVEITEKKAIRTLTLKPLGHFFFQNVILLSHVIHSKWSIMVWNHSSTRNISSTLWILMAWCFSTRASVATVLNTHPCVSRCLRVKYAGSYFTVVKVSSSP